MYVNGQGVQQDYVEAVKWFRRAADQGNAGAQLNLGFSIHNGKGVQRTMPRRSSGIAERPSRAMLVRSSTWA